ncbi:MAG: ATP-binding protein [Candidatus Cloacimonetes bacterium]|nr:ATP-binding protein [Candidatus Cloacimonadota bacterium]
MLKRNLYYECLNHLQNDEVTIITGARQVGKTTILKQIENYLTEKGLPCFYINLEDPDFLQLLNDHPRNIFNLFSLPKNQKIYFLVDEIQYLNNSSNFLKYLYDEFSKRIKLIVSGSSAFYMDTKFKDSLAGRKKIFILYTLSIDEFLLFNNKPDLARLITEIPYQSLTIENIPVTEQREISYYIERYLIYGGYPRVVLASTDKEKEELLNELLYSYIKKDIMESGIKNQQKALELLKILSDQISSLLNTNTLSKLLRVSTTAIDNYIHTLKKSFHIAAVSPYFTNIRKEIKKMPKMYFLDLGLRNALIRNFNLINYRQDIGKLYENFIFRQFLDRLPLEQIHFWRTQQQNEVDFVLNEKYVYEVKYNLANFVLSKYKKFISLYPGKMFNVVYRIGEAEKLENVFYRKF